MHVARRALLSSGKRVPYRQSLRRYASDPSHTQPHQHSEPVNESFGRGFYLTLATIPLSIALYQYSTSEAENGKEPFLQRLLNDLWYKQGEWERVNALHQEASEKAAFDRHLFANASVNHAVNLSYAEGLNQRSPHNVVAGQQGADLRKLKAYYDEKHEKMEEERIARIGKDGKVRTVYDT